MRIFDRKLTNRSIQTLECLKDALELKTELGDCLAALHHSKLLSYAKKEGMTRRFGTRVKKNVTLSLVLQVINGMAEKIDELEKEK